MPTVIRNVRDIDQADRAVLEHVVGGELRENQQLIIQVVNVDVAAGNPVHTRGTLPDWCNVYEGLTDEEIEEIEKSIVRTPGSRKFD